MKWAIVGKPNVNHVYKEMVEVVDQLKKRKQSVVLEQRFAELLNVPGKPLSELDADVIITVGGDGTILMALEHTDRPILAVNAGGVGFLSEVEPKYIGSALDRVLKKDFTLEERPRLSSWLDKERLPDAANEITVQTAKIAKLIKYQVRIDGEVMDTLRGDGVIVATATGSTGYNLSVGGPILHPAVQGMVISPIAPFRLAARPVVIPFDSLVTVTLVQGATERTDKIARAVVDGQHGYAVNAGSQVTIKPSKRKARFIRFDGGFYERVRTKLTR
ncbi:MAG: NAD(+)/NADH kinase [Euryarchaeota archaeon]|nr:NAD(+)/NADH kinase [Euryarchaeota archaeon]